MKNNLQDFAQQFLKFSGNYYCLADSNGFFIELSDNWSNVIGWSKEELLSKPFIEFVHPADRANTLNETEQLIKGKESIKFTNRCLTSENDYITLSWQAYYEKDEDLIFWVCTDITELATEKKRLSGTQKAAKLGTWYVDIVNDQAHWSETVYDIHEVEYGTEIKVSEGINYYIDEHKPIIQKCVEDGVKNNKPWDVELQIKTAKGNVRWVKAVGYPIIVNGELKRLEGTFQDIDQRKMKEKEFELLNQRLDLALEGAHLGIWDWFLGDNSVVFDRRWCEMLGLDVESIDMNLETWESRVHPEDLEQCYADIKAYLDKETPYYENIHRMKHADGHWVYILDRGRISELDEDGNAVRFTGTHLDITIMKKNEVELANALQLQQVSYEVLKISEGSDKLEDKLNRCISELLEIHWMGDILRGDILIKDKENILKLVSSKSKDDQPGKFGESTDYTKCLCGQDSYIDTKSLKSMYHECNVNEGVDHFLLPLSYNRDLMGMLILYISHSHVSDKEKVKMLEFISKNISNLIAKVQTEEEVERERTKLVQAAKMSTLGEMAGGVAHEINNPLTIVHGYADILTTLAGKSNTIDSLTVSKLSTDISRSVMRMAKIVEGLRVFARDGSLDEFEYVDIKKVLEDTLEFCKSRFTNHEINLILDLPSDLNVECQGIQISQVLLNLLNNAFDAVKDSSTSKKYVKLSAFIEDGHAIIEVEDNGDGITAENAHRILEPFFTTKTIGQGTGLGLSISKGIIDSHGGSLQLLSTANPTVFRIVLPLRQSEELAA